MRRRPSPRRRHAGTTPKLETHPRAPRTASPLHADRLAAVEGEE
ncbi:MAG TPA: hypothetical protein VF586_21760 [Pyrinomonadaceae bacterium]